MVILRVVAVACEVGGKEESAEPRVEVLEGEVVEGRWTFLVVIAVGGV